MEFLNELMPVPGTVGYGTVIRSIRTPMVDHWLESREEARDSPGDVISKLAGANRANLPVSGQSAGGIHEILPADEIVRRLARQAEEALQSAESFIQR